MRLLDNYIAGQWIPAGPNPTLLLNAVNGDPVAGADSSDIDMAQAFAYARSTGGEKPWLCI
jgi:hypothetical protein